MIDWTTRLATGAREQRSISFDDFELRETGGRLQFTGYASLFDVPYPMYGGPDEGGYTETVRSSAFNRTLKAKPNVVLNMDHGAGGSGLPIARTTYAEDLFLSADKTGLLVDAPKLDPMDPDVQLLQVKMRNGHLREMSFAFFTKGQTWNENRTERDLTELSLDGGDVSIVTNGAQPKTSGSIRSLLDGLASFDDLETAFAEVRDADSLDTLQNVYDQIGRIINRPPARGMSVAHAKRLLLL